VTLNNEKFFFFGDPFEDTIQSITVDLGQGANIINVPALRSGVTLTVNGSGGGSNTVQIGRNSNLATTGDVSKVLGNVVVNASGTSVIVDDSNDTAGRTATLGTNSLSWTGLGSLQFGNGSVSSLDVIGGSATNTLLVQGTSAYTTTTLDLRGPNDAVVVGDAQHNVSGVGSVTVNGDGSTTLSVDDRGNQLPPPGYAGYQLLYTQYYVFDHTLTRVAPALVPNQLTPQPFVTTVGYSGLAGLTIEGAPSTLCYYQIDGTGGTSALTVNARGADIITVGDAQHNVSAVGSVAVNGDGSTTLSVDDRGNATPPAGYLLYLPQLTQYFVSDHTLTRAALAVVLLPGQLVPQVQVFGSSVTYSGLAGLTIDGGPGSPFNYQVQSTASSTPVTLATGAGLSVISVTPDTQDLTSIQGALTVKGGQGATLITLHDEKKSVPDQYTITSATTTIKDPAVINYSNIQALTLDGAASGTYDIESIPQGTIVTINAGAGANTLRIASSVQSGLVLNVGSGDLSVDDTAGSAATTYLVTSSTVQINNLPPITYTGARSLTVMGGGGTDTFNVESTAAATPVTLAAGAGSNTFNLSPTAHDLSTLGGAVAILGGSGFGALSLYDQANVFPGSPPVYTITANTVGRPGVAALTYNGVKAVNLNTGSAAAPANPWGFINVSSTAAGTATTVNAGSGYIVQVGGGPNRLDGVLGPVTVNGLGYDALNIVDNNGTTGYVYTLSYDALSGRSRVARAGYAAIDFASISYAAQITAGSGDDTFNIEGKDPACFLSIWGGGGNNTFNVSPTAQNLDGVRGAIAIQGTGPGTTGGSATLTINDQADPIDRGWRLTRGGVTLTTVVGIGYQDVNQVTVNAGGGNNSFNVEGLTSTIPVTVNAGSGTTAVNVGVIGNTLDPLVGSLVVHGAGVTSVNFNNQGADPHIGHGDYWSANQADFYNAQHLHVDFTGVAQMTLSDPALTTNSHTFYAMPAVGQLTINGAGNDIIQAVAPAVGQNDWWITGHNAGNLNNVVSFNNVYFLETAYSGTDVFHLLGNASETAIGNPGSGATPVLDLSGYTPGAVVKLPGPTAWGSVGTDTGFNGIKRIIGTAGNDTLVGPDYATTWVLSGTNAGRVPGAAYYAQVFVADVAFTSFENLRGGSAADTFAFQSGGGVSGRIDGGGVTTTLDYSAYVGDIVVDLARGTANGTGGVAGIANVTGSQGNDILVGDANPNVLRGGTGRNLIIGGAGADQLFGGGGDNIQIGGTTAYDQDLTALAALMKEFTRTDLNFHQRVDHLMNGTGLNGSYVLNTDPSAGPVTVFDDGVADVLNAGGALDWFFVHKKEDVIVNQKPGDKVTPV
jgi:hypothetical protein